MLRARASIAMILADIALISVGLAAPRVSSRLWANVGSSLAVTPLVAAVPGLFHLRGPRRAFAMGFALFGWTYLLPSFGPAPFNAWRDLLITTPALVILEDDLIGATLPTSPGPGSGTFVELTPWSYWTASDRSNPFASDSFNRIGRSFFCIGIAIGGGGSCRFPYSSRDASRPSP